MMTETVAVFMLSVLAGIVANYIYDFLCKIFKVLWTQKRACARCSFLCYCVFTISLYWYFFIFSINYIKLLFIILAKYQILVKLIQSLLESILFIHDLFSPFIYFPSSKISVALSLKSSAKLKSLRKFSLTLS